MKHYCFEGSLDTETIRPLLDFLGATFGEPKTIVFTSVGGALGCEAILHRAIQADRENITLIAADHIYSSAMNLFASVTCQREIQVGTIGMAHLPSVNVPMVSVDVTRIETRMGEILVRNTARNKLEQAHLDSMERVSKMHIAFWDKLMTYHEFEVYRTGEDVVFSDTRIAEMLNVPIVQF